MESHHPYVPSTNLPPLLQKQQKQSQKQKPPSAISAGKQKAKDQHLLWGNYGIGGKKEGGGVGTGGFNINLLGGKNGMTGVIESKAERIKRLKVLEERMKMVEERIQLEKDKKSNFNSTSPSASDSSTSNNYCFDAPRPRMLSPTVFTDSNNDDLNPSSYHLYDIIGVKAVIIEPSEDERKKQEGIYQAQMIHMEAMFNYQERRRSSLKAAGSTLSAQQEKESQAILLQQQQRRDSNPMIQLQNATTTATATTPRPSTSSSSGSNSNSSRSTTGTTTSTGTRRQSEPMIITTTSSLQARRGSSNSNSSKFALSQDETVPTGYLPNFATSPATQFESIPKLGAHQNQQFMNSETNFSNIIHNPPVLPPSVYGHSFPSTTYSNQSRTPSNSNQFTKLTQSSYNTPSQTSALHSVSPANQINYQTPFNSTTNSSNPNNLLQHSQPIGKAQSYPSPQAQPIQPHHHYHQHQHQNYPISNYGSPADQHTGNGSYMETYDSKPVLVKNDVANSYINVDPSQLNFQQTPNTFEQGGGKSNLNSSELYESTLMDFHNTLLYNSPISTFTSIPSSSSTSSSSTANHSNNYLVHSSMSKFHDLSQSTYLPSPSASTSNFINYPSPTNSISDRRGSTSAQNQVYGDQSGGYVGENGMMLMSIEEGGLDGFGERSSKRRKEF